MVILLLFTVCCLTSNIVVHGTSKRESQVLALRTMHSTENYYKRKGKSSNITGHLICPLLSFQRLFLKLVREGYLKLSNRKEL